MRAGDITGGALGGLAAGAMMTGVMAAGSRAGLISTPLPVRVVRRVEERLGAPGRLTGKAEKLVALAEHLALSALLGAAYGVIHRGLRLEALPAGPLFGAAVYAVNLGVVAPRFGVTSGPAHEPRKAELRRFVMHALFGLVTAVVLERVAGGNAGPRSRTPRAAR